MLLLIDIVSINKGRGYENPSLEIIVTECCSTGGCPLKEACEHCYLNQSSIYVAISYIISVYGEDLLDILLSFCHFYHFISVLHILYIWYLAMYVPTHQLLSQPCTQHVPQPKALINFIIKI